MAVHWGGKGPGHVSRWPRGVGAISPYSGATMLLDFLNPVLDPRITFSRGTNAMLIDSTGRLTYAPNNLLARSQEIAVSPWAGDTSGGTIPTSTANAGIAPDGTNTATRLQINRGAGTFSRWQQVTGPFPAGSFVASIWMRTTSGTGTANVGLRNDTTGVNCAVTGTWQRFSVVNSPAAVNPSIQILSFTGIPGTDVSADILVWGAQLEAVTYQTTPSTYVATTTSAYYGPRFDYDPVTLAPRGLLIEEARTNILTYSDDFSNAAWTKFLITVTANSTASPDGTSNADTFTGAGGGTTAIRQTLSTASGAHTATIYAKAGTKSVIQFSANALTWGIDARANFDLTNGVLGTVDAGLTATITNAGNGWYRCSVAATKAATAGTLLWCIVDSPTSAREAAATAGTLFAWGAQLEAGAFATSYIPTVASTVTRNADVATMTGTNFSSWYNQSQGTFVAEGLVASNVDSGTGNYYYSASDGTISNMILSAEVNGTVSQVITGGVVQFNETVGGEPTGVLKVAVAYQANNTVSSANGAIGTTDTSVTLPTVDRLGIGARGDLSATSYLSGHIRTIAYFNTRLPNAQLQTLTAPSLATTLSLDFTSGSYNVGF